MTETAETITAEHAILRALFYFEIFAYPLTAAEVFQFVTCTDIIFEQLVEKLETLVNHGIVFRFGHFFQTKNDSSWVPHRHDCNHRADKLLPVARRMARFIGAFPYIRGVFVSGSLSKHCMSADSDIDFFIVTEPGRLWLARTLLVFFKKIFLFNSHKYFCVNYFVDTDHLEIEEKNLFTATEIATLLPMYGREWYEAFCSANGWAWVYFPHLQPRLSAEAPPHSKPFLKKLLEKMLRGKTGQWLDIRVMQFTVGFWKRKFKQFDEKTFDLAFKSRRYVSKHHPLHFQEKVLKAFEKRGNDLKI